MLCCRIDQSVDKDNPVIFDRYLFKNLMIATVFVAVTLAAVIFLTQSLRFLELVIHSGASSSAFWLLTMLALPRFFEIILPIALMAGTVFVYNKLTMDSELIVMRQAGMPPLSLARPALAAAGVVTVVLWLVTMWLRPVSLASMQNMRQVIKAQYSTLLFREGVFNAMVPGLTVFVRERDRDGELHGLMIHDTRDDNPAPVTVLAKRGVVVVTPEGQQVLVYDGSRQSMNAETGALDRLDFERYSIDLPEGSGPVRQRWKEPDERTFLALLHPDPEDIRDQENRWEFTVEAHRRIVSPLLAPAFALIALSFLLLGPLDRRGQGWRIVAAVLATVALQGFYLAAFNMARHSGLGLVLMYVLLLVPLGSGMFLLSGSGEKLRQRWLFTRRKGRPA